MSSRTVKELQELPNVQLAHEFALDVLNQTFPDLVHLHDIQRALDDALQNHVQLQQRLIQSDEEICTLTANTRVEVVSQLDKAKELATLRDTLEDDLAYLSHDLVSTLDPAEGENTPTLLEDVETLHRALKELESVRSYVAIVERALQLSEQALVQMRNSHSPLTAAMTSEYQTLLAFVDDVKRTCSPVEEIGNSHGSLNLISFLDKTCQRTWGGMKAVLFSTLVSASENLKWPTAVDYFAASKEDRAAFELAVSDLLKLQEIGDSLHPSREDDGLYPLQALVQPVALRFKYHFDSDRETNRLDKPEWYLTHIANVAHDHRPFMEGVMQRLLSGSKFSHVNAWHHYTTLLLPILERKLKRSVPVLLARPALLAHTVYQLLMFDSGLRDMGYEFAEDKQTIHDGTEAERGGISNVILNQKDWFDAWLEGEKKFADDQYHEIISASDAWAVADDNGHESNHSSQDTTLKATTSARRIKVLVEQVTDRYSPLPSFRQRTQFLIRVQLPILELYLSRISSSLDAFETLSSALVRAVPGALSVESPKTDTRKLTGGVEGSQRLCKALLSARYIENAMRSWGEDVFFLELWEEINRRASLRIAAGSQPHLPEPHPKTSHGTTTSEETIFEELVAQFAKLCSRAEDMLVQQICGECESALKTHFSALATSLQDLDDSSAEVAVPSTLLPSVALLSSHLSFLRNMLPASVVTRLYRRAASRISEHVLQRQVLFRPGLSRSSARHGSTRTQARVVQAECELWAETCRVAMNASHARVEKPWSRLLAAGRLLGADLHQHERVLDVLVFGGGGGGGSGGKSEVGEGGGWEALLDDLTGLGAGGLTVDEVRTVLRMRDDCRRPG